MQERGAAVVGCGSPLEVAQIGELSDQRRHSVGGNVQESRGLLDPDAWVPGHDGEQFHLSRRPSARSGPLAHLRAETAPNARQRSAQFAHGLRGMCCNCLCHRCSVADRRREPKNLLGERRPMPPVDVAAEPRNRAGVGANHPHYKWWALSCTSLGMLIATINSGTLIIALPTLESSLHTSLLQLVWVILAYMIASTVLVLSTGRLSDLFGRKTAFVAGFVVFALASLGAGFAGTGTELIIWRVVQGIGGALLFANAAAIVTDAFPASQLGVAMGTNVMVAAVGLVFGPVLGGALVSISWQWVFWFNVPFGLAGALWGLAILRDTSRRDSVRGLDPVGMTPSSSVDSPPRLCCSRCSPTRRLINARRCST